MEATKAVMTAASSPMRPLLSEFVFSIFQLLAAGRLIAISN
jgi:hypothetical protein